MKRLFLLFILLNLIIPQITLAAPPLNYNKEVASDVALRGAIFAVDASNLYAAVCGDNLCISSPVHREGVTLKFKVIALYARMKNYNGLNVGVTHIAGDGAITHTIKQLKPDNQGFAYATFDFSTVIISGLTGTTTFTETGLSGNYTKTFNEVNVSYIDFNITNHQSNAYAYGNDLYIDFSPNESMVLGSNSDLPLQGYFNISSGVSADGANVRIHHSNGTEIPREIESYSNNNLSVFFKPDTTDNTTNVTYQLWYGNLSAPEPAADSTYGSEAVWDSNYVGVWHMNDDPSTTTMKDSTENGYHLTSTGAMTSGDLVDSAYGKGITFDGVDDGLHHVDDAGLDGFTTINLLARLKTSSSDLNKGIVTKWYAGTTSYAIRTGAASAGKIDSGVYTGADTRVISAAAYNDGNEHTAILNYDGSDIYNIVDGTSASGARTGAVANSDENFAIGMFKDGALEAGYFTGTVSEVRLQNTNMSSNWDTTSHKNLNNPTAIGTGAFYKLIGSPQQEIYSTNITTSVIGDINTTNYSTDIPQTHTLTPTANISEIVFNTTSTDWDYIAILYWTNDITFIETASNGEYHINVTAIVPLNLDNGTLNYTIINNTLLDADFSNYIQLSTNDSNFNESESNLSLPDISLHTSAITGTYYYDLQYDYFYAPSSLAVADFNYTWINTSWVGDIRADNYSVYRNGAFLDNTTDLYYNFTGLNEGTDYTLGVSLWNGSQETGKTALVQSTTNPNGTKITFLDLLDNSDTEFHIYNASGYAVGTVLSNGSDHTLPSGAYVVQVLPANAGYATSPLMLFDLLFAAIQAVVGIVLVLAIALGLGRFMRIIMEARV